MTFGFYALLWPYSTDLKSCTNYKSYWFSISIIYSRLQLKMVCQLPESRNLSLTCYNDKDYVLGPGHNEVKRYDYKLLHSWVKYIWKNTFKRAEVFPWLSHRSASLPSHKKCNQQQRYWYKKGYDFVLETAVDAWTFPPWCNQQTTNQLWCRNHRTCGRVLRLTTIIWQV